LALKRLASLRSSRRFFSQAGSGVSSGSTNPQVHGRARKQPRSWTRPHICSPTAFRSMMSRASWAARVATSSRTCKHSSAECQSSCILRASATRTLAVAASLDQSPASMGSRIAANALRSCPTVEFGSSMASICCLKNSLRTLVSMAPRFDFCTGLPGVKRYYPIRNKKAPPSQLPVTRHIAECPSLGGILQYSVTGARKIRGILQLEQGKSHCLGGGPHPFIIAGQIHLLAKLLQEVEGCQV